MADFPDYQTWFEDGNCAPGITQCIVQYNEAREEHEIAQVEATEAVAQTYSSEVPEEYYEPLKAYYDELVSTATWASNPAEKAAALTDLKLLEDYLGYEGTQGGMEFENVTWAELDGYYSAIEAASAEDPPRIILDDPDSEGTFDFPDVVVPAEYNVQIGTQSAEFATAYEEYSSLVTAATNALSPYVGDVDLTDFAAAADQLGMTPAELAALTAAIESGDQADLAEALAAADLLQQTTPLLNQCALLYVMHTLSQKYEAHLSLNKNNLIYPNNGKIIRINGGRKSSGIHSKLTGCQYFKYLKQLTPKHVSLLTPKLTIFKVMNKADTTVDIPISFDEYGTIEGGKLKQNSARVDVSSLLKNKINRGFGAGIKSFNWSYAGTNFASARRDIKASLSIHASSFEDLLLTRVYTDDDKVSYEYRIIDLIIHPKKLGEAQADENQSRPAASSNLTVPRDYKIRIEAGWNEPSSNVKPLFKDIIEEDHLSDFFSCLTESMFLVLVDHDINIGEKGDVTLTVDYRAYMEETLRGPQFNILFPDEIIYEEAKNLRDAYDEAIEPCKNLDIDNLDSSDSLGTALKQVNEQYNSTIQSLKYRGMQSLMKNLRLNKRLFYASISRVDMVRARYGLDLENLMLNNNNLNTADDSQTAGVADAIATADVSELQELTENTLKAYAEAVTVEDENVPVSFFFLGDLIDTVYDYPYQANKGDDEDFPDVLKVILTDFPYVNEMNQIQYINVAHIPIATDFFVEWYATNIIATDVEIYPLMDFIREITRTLISDVLSKECVRSPSSFTTRFQSAFMRSPLDGGVEKFDKLKEDCEAWHGEGPCKTTSGGYQHSLNGGDIETGMLRTPGGTDSKDIANYLIFYPYNTIYLNDSESGLNPDGVDYITEKIEEDEESGIVHLTIGSATGFVKKINFAKNNIPGLREARFERYELTDDLSQLSNVYDATVDLYGMPNFYPGNRVYIEPWALGLGYPLHGPTADRTKPSAAWSIGIGGYHIITEVNSQISRAGYTSTLKCRWESSDGLKRLFDVNNDGEITKTDPADCKAALEVFTSKYNLVSE